MNHPIHWLYQQYDGVVETGNVWCYLCGSVCTEQHAVKAAIADTFNSHFLCLAPSSPFVCDACAWYFDRSAGHPDFYKMSLIVEEYHWHNWQRDQMKLSISDWLKFGISTNAYLVCSLTKKKHILLQAPMNVKGSRVLAVQVEEQVAHVDQAVWALLNQAFMRLLDLGHNKSEALSGDLYSNTLRKHGQIKEAMLHSDMLAPYRGSPALTLLSYVTIVDKAQSESEVSAHDTTTNNQPEAETAGHGSRSGVGRVDGDTSRLQKQIPHGHLDAGRDQHRGDSQNDDQSGSLSQSPLWEI